MELSGTRPLASIPSTERKEKETKQNKTKLIKMSSLYSSHEILNFPLKMFDSELSLSTIQCNYNSHVSHIIITTFPSIFQFRRHFQYIIACDPQTDKKGQLLLSLSQVSDRGQFSQETH